MYGHKQKSIPVDITKKDNSVYFSFLLIGKLFWDVPHEISLWSLKNTFLKSGQYSWKRPVKEFIFLVQLEAGSL